MKQTKKNDQMMAPWLVWKKNSISNRYGFLGEQFKFNSNKFVIQSNNIPRNGDAYDSKIFESHT